ncbi:MAG: PilZ domain-containing protein [Nitrospiraceae bacterium]|nr:MAG: PilZ domain-containing protein [Nitrospiraceae bacterium]
MNKRRHKRFIITLNAQVVIGEKTYDGIISNVSEEGVSSTITTYIKTDDAFSPQKKIRLIFELPTGDLVELECEIRWYLRPQEKGKNLMLGLYIMEPPVIYREWIQKFQ